MYIKKTVCASASIKKGGELGMGGFIYCDFQHSASNFWAAMLKITKWKLGMWLNVVVSDISKLFHYSEASPFETILQCP